ncbi:transcription initiation TFIID-like protein [Plasmodium vivax Brazil I]|uniref:Transcription initiation TFIID-like protein n=1 Tax=Plasmodium vivax (strain Brazil I) TaxID=1033975 RepID=A0A0J9SL01_PLAV1|nr:transcription initiation TFIID-like protein [Plasmodium vivax Brazil I]
MSVHNISMNATLCSSLNLDSLYRHFANCIYNPREFKCMRIDVPVSTRSISKYVRFVQQKGGRQTGETQTGEKQTGEKPTGEKQTGEKPTGEEHKGSEGVIPPSDGTSVVTPSAPPPDVATTCQVVEATTSQGGGNPPEEHTEANEKVIINVSIFANGKIICTGNNSIEACKIAMKKIERKLKQLNFKNISIKNVTITNILAVYNVGFSIVLPLFAQHYKSVDYDPNVFPACKVKIALTSDSERDTSEASEQAEGNFAWSTPRSTAERSRSKVDVVSASIFSTGNITLTGGKSYQNLQRCIDILYPYLIKSKSQH